MSIKQALAAALESDMNEETHDIVEEGFDDAISPTESIATAIDAHEEGVGLIESMHEVADAAEDTVEFATIASVESYQRNVRHLLKPHKLTDTAPSLESIVDPKEAQIRVAQETRALANKLVPAVEALNPSMENRFTYIFKSKEGKIKDASQRLNQLERELANKTSELEENPIEINHRFIYQFMTYENNVCKDPVGQAKKDIKLIEDLYKAVGSDALDFMRALNSELAKANSDEDLEAAYGRLKSKTGPAVDAIKLLGGSLGKPVMGNYRIFAEETKGVARDDAGGWKVGAKVDWTGKKEVKANNPSFWWFTAGAVAGALTIGSLPAMAIGGSALYQAQKGKNIKSHLSAKEMKDLVSQAKDLVRFAEKAVDEYKNMDVLFMETLNHLKKLPNGGYGKVMSQMVNVTYNTFHSGMQAVYKHTFYLIGGTTALAEKVVSGAK